ncbi:aldo/keto reductase [Cellulomonas dongxiuzhuiae]|uniref:Aldo/keto reductase n=1 Tax=Cellulomonas dongxiuzhuiae TaxID=2819979 RepID=A0ABX8GHM4_9CELL|nr:aldo/keto reductase [Cellulomonas dongxiuzhuiae]MBO3088293.1 aldo/keto reductase [Cellulomonas dongxiuzhuiae]MBO3094375.1 aldo/keto reductase [Cellulomonas dongxiuzhuiae]QWC15408.1 aldo/keto reductase [Cellulomonas dongxiuzhuiae]
MPDTTTPTLTLPGGAIPVLGLGTWQSEGSDAELAVSAALQLGYRHVDTATGYGNEAQVGRVLATRGIDRDDVFLTTKLPPDHADRARQTLMESLAALGTDHLDLWLIHWPPGKQARPDVWEELRRSRDEGHVRSIGVSNYSIAQIDELIAATGEAPAVNQIPYSPVDHDAALLAAHRERGVVVEGYSPLKRTDLAAEPIAAAARAHGVTPAQVVLRWHLEHDVVVIPKSVRPERLEENLAVLGFTLSPDEVAAIDTLGR